MIHDKTAHSVKHFNKFEKLETIFDTFYFVIIKISGLKVIKQVGLVYFMILH
jgi:hypothetical protein